jgi:glycerophosphoryl diester phosphodiesterase
MDGNGVRHTTRRRETTKIEEHTTMKSYKEIVDKFERASEYHTFIQSFGHGGLDKLNDAMNQPYPLLWIRPLASSGIQPYGQRTLAFEVYLLDVPKLDRTTDIQTMSDAERALYDVYAYFRDGAEQQEYEISMTTITPVMEAFQDRMFGWVANTNILTTSQGITICNIPTEV